MHKIEATFRIVTPMFIAGADQGQAELRAPSIKGALRFWWRALAWSRFNGDLNAIRRQESSLFGDAGEHGQSQMLMAIRGGLKGDQGGDALLNNDASRKYLGYGLFSMGGHSQRYAIPEGKTFHLTITMKDDDADREEQLRGAIRALGLIGGLGSRSRNGFGSLSLSEFAGESVSFQSIGEYRKALEELFDIDHSHDGIPPFTACSTSARIVMGPLKGSSQTAHQYIGAKYKQFRTDRQHEQRKKFFGLPLDGYDDEKRRASPLFFHVHPVGQKFVPVILYLPANFHPEYKNHDYSLVEEFLDEYEREAAQ
jgi:CRISPR-associated protein Cmr1